MTLRTIPTKWTARSRCSRRTSAPSVLDRISVEYYGVDTPIGQVGTIASPDARTLVIQPWDGSLLKAIEKAIQTSDLGINPQNDGRVIRLVFPQLTEERRKDLVKGFFISGFTVAIVFSPWLAVTCRQFILRMRYDDGSTAELATLNSVMDYFKEWFSAVETPIGIVVLLGMALCLVLSYGAVDWVRQHHNAAPAIAAAAFALTGIVGGVISATVNNCFMGRYAFPGMGFVMVDRWHPRYGLSVFPASVQLGAPSGVRRRPGDL